MRPVPSHLVRASQQSLQRGSLKGEGNSLTEGIPLVSPSAGNLFFLYLCERHYDEYDDDDGRWCLSWQTARFVLREVHMIWGRPAVAWQP